MATPREVDEEPAVYLVVSGIPPVLRSAQLRSYFSQFREQRGGGFLCFHYRHRPERGPTQAIPDAARAVPSRDSTPVQTRTCCCIVSVRGVAQAQQLLRMYSGRRWLDSQGTWLPGRCHIRRLRLPTEASGKRERERIGFPILGREAQFLGCEDRSDLWSPPLSSLRLFWTKLQVFSPTRRNLKGEKSKQRLM